MKAGKFNIWLSIVTMAMTALVVVGVYLKFKGSGAGQVPGARQVSETSLSDLDSTNSDKANAFKKASEIAADTNVLPTDHYVAADTINDLVQEDLSSRANRALFLLDFPPPKDNIEVSETEGPPVASCLYKFKKGDTLTFRLFRIISDSKAEEALPSGWLDQGRLVVKVKDYDAEKGAASLMIGQMGATEIRSATVDSGALEKIKMSDVEDVVFTNGSRGKIVSKEVGLSLANSNESISIQREGTMQQGRLIFPSDAKEIKVGQTWEIPTSDKDNPGNYQRYTFEGYSLVDGKRCMRIKESSQATTTAQMRPNDSTVKTQNHTVGYHYFDPDLGARRRVDFASHITYETDNATLHKVLGQRETTIRTIQQLVH